MKKLFLNIIHNSNTAIICSCVIISLCFASVLLLSFFRRSIDIDATSSTLLAVIPTFDETELSIKKNTTVQEITTIIETTTVPDAHDITETTEEFTIASDDIAGRHEVEYYDKSEGTIAYVPPTEAEPVTTVKSTENAPQKPTEAALYEVSGLFMGIDVSVYQGLIDWAKVKASGIKFAMIRVGFRGYEFGIIQDDYYFEHNIENALANGVQVGVYFFSQAVNETEAKAEADYVLSKIKKYKFTYPVAFDWERCDPDSNETSRSYNFITSNSSANIKAKFNQIIPAFCDTIKNAGYNVMVYSSRNDLKHYFDASYISSKYRIWLAAWYGVASEWPVASNATTGYNDLPTSPCSYQMWQYTNSGNTTTVNYVSGINGRVDLDIAFFSYAGTQVSTEPMQLNVTKTQITTNMNTPVNLLSGVTARNTAKADITSKVTYKITNSKSEICSDSVAFSTPGSYTVTYSVTDFTGATKTKTCNLKVRALPTFIIPEEPIIVNNDITTDEILELLKSKIIVRDCDGNDITGNITITSITDLDITSEANTDTTSMTNSDTTSVVETSSVDVETTSNEVSSTTIIDETTTPAKSIIPYKEVLISVTDTKSAVSTANITIYLEQY